MKVLFLHDAGSTQAGPIWRARPHLLDLGIELLGGRDRKDIDLVLMQQTQVRCMPEWAERDHVPIVILERIDGSQVTSTTRLLMKTPRVVSVIKNTLWQDRTLYNRCGWRFHEDTLRLQRGQPLNPPPGVELEPHELAKLRLGFSFGAYQKLDGFAQEVDFGAERSIDVFFAGTVEYGDELITGHRRQCVEVIRNLKGLNVVCRPGRSMNADLYRQTMLQSKIVVSPWGWGESCFRDYEALLCGSVLIKPVVPEGDWEDDCGILDHSLPVSLLFADLPDVVAHGLQNFDEWHRQRWEWREGVLASRSPYNVALKLQNLLVEASSEFASVCINGIAH